MGANVQRTTSPAGDPAWLVSRYETVKALLADPRLGRSHPTPDRAARYSESMIFGRPQPVSATEAADHARMRRLLAPWFSARRLAALRPRVRELADGLLEELISRGTPADAHEAVAFPLPVLVICELLGVPYADHGDFRRWSDDAADMTDQARSIAGLSALWQYMNGLIETKLEDPGPDLLSALVAEHRADPGTVGRDQIARLAAGLLFAGHETTVAAIDTGIVLLAIHPAQRDALAADRALIPGAVEEILRAALPTADPAAARRTGLPRWAREPLDVDGVTIPAGDLVLLGLHQANRQLDGDRPGFDITRDPNPHLTFGHGPHYCIGAPLARLELQVLLGALLDRLPGFALAVPVDELRPRDDLLTGGLAALPITW